MVAHLLTAPDFIGTSSLEGATPFSCLLEVKSAQYKMHPCVWKQLFVGSRVSQSNDAIKHVCICNLV